jgi:hypothetical protein
MREIIKDLLTVQGTKAVLFFSNTGKLVFAEPDRWGNRPINASDWAKLLEPVGAAREADLVFEGGRVVIRGTDEGQLVVVTEAAAPSAMIRLHCDIAVPKLSAAKPAKGIKRFFKR